MNNPKVLDPEQYRAILASIYKALDALLVYQFSNREIWGVDDADGIATLYQEYKQIKTLLHVAFEDTDTDSLYREVKQHE